MQHSSCHRSANQSLELLESLSHLTSYLAQFNFHLSSECEIHNNISLFIYNICNNNNSLRTYGLEMLLELLFNFIYRAILLRAKHFEAPPRSDPPYPPV